MNIQHIIQVAGGAFTTIVTIASAICAATPTPDPNTKLGKLYKIIEFLAFNFGKAKDKGPIVPKA